MSALRHHLRRTPRAQALVEFALVLPLIIVLLAMAIDLGRVFYGWVSIQNAARVGASYAASNADAWESPNDAARQATYAQLVQNDLQALNCALASVPPPTFTDSNGNTTHDTGEPVDVDLDCTFSLITPIGQTILGPVSLGGTSTFPVHYTIRTALPPPPPPPPPPTCTVPSTVTQSRNTARTLWKDASFQPGNLIENGSGNFTVATQSQTALTDIPCTSSMTIAAAAGPTPTGCAKPTAAFEPTVKITGKSPVVVQFTDRSVSSGCPILTWQWTFAGGVTTTDTLPSPSHTFTHSGSGQTKYDVTLVVTNASGASNPTKIKDLVVVTDK